jgi:hypothetical protein
LDDDFLKRDGFLGQLDFGGLVLEPVVGNTDLWTETDKSEVQGIIASRLDFKIAFVVRNRSLDLVEVDDIDIGIGSELLSLTMLPETF